ncbi:MAG: hypothetical protein FGM46_10105 [Ferruginibacter sp.]|nr:hypothetical protein [Ferruginibacter sp.]
MNKKSHTDYFKGRQLLIVTKHEKEKAIAPILEKWLGVKCIVDHTLDTDLLGTFTGELERADDPLSTVRKKCMMAMEQSKYDLAIASEGSFGAHPSIFFSTADDEIVMLVDKKNNLEIYSRELSTETNFNAKQIHSVDELIAFANETKFPSHGLILRKNKDDFTLIFKDNRNRRTLISHFNKIQKSYGSVYVETDMRAMNNPTRMKIIKAATKKLIHKILSVCPNCNTPGFSITEVKQGLPCEICHAPTRSPLSYLYNCKKCNHLKEDKYPHKKNWEDPMYCDYCNP